MIERQTTRQVVLPAQTYIDGIRAHDRAALARAITLVESTQALHEATAQEVLQALLPDTGKSIRLGISGSPGVGKSTFIETLGMHLLDAGHRVAVLAIDPTSPRTGGSVLGDKTRMARLSMDDRAFIRPSPTMGNLGGVTRRTREAMLLCEAAGFDVIIIETVGVGQSETTVANIVDFFLVLQLASAGDELQGIKRGILEVADLIAINKIDTEAPAVVNRAMADYRHALRIVRGHEAGASVLGCSGLSGSGVDIIWNTVVSSIVAARDSGALAARRSQQLIDWLWSTAESTLIASLHGAAEVAAIKNAIESDVRSGRMTPVQGAAKLLEAHRRDCT